MSPDLCLSTAFICLNHAILHKTQELFIFSETNNFPKLRKMTKISNSKLNLKTMKQKVSHNFGYTITVMLPLKLKKKSNFKFKFMKIL